jgi:hypothetical protein
VDEEGQRLARHLADTADAWLRDPRDRALYGRLVDAVDAWRAYVQPTLDGTEHAGRRGAAAAARRPDVDDVEPTPPTIAQTSRALLRQLNAPAGLLRQSDDPDDGTGDRGKHREGRADAIPVDGQSH